MVNSHLVCDHTIWVSTSLGNSGLCWTVFARNRDTVCRRKWRLTDTDLCPCGETQTMSHIVESCPLTKLNGGLSQLHSADEDAVSWLTNYGKWHAYEKKYWSPNISYSVVVRNVEKRSVIRIQDRIVTRSWSVLPITRLSHDTKCQWKRLITPAHRQNGRLTSALVEVNIEWKRGKIRAWEWVRMG